MRSDEGQGSSPPKDAVDLLEAQHDRVRKLFHLIENDVRAGVAAEDALVELCHRLAIHEAAERVIVYPVVRGARDDADDLASERIAEEGTIADLLTELESRDPRAPDFHRRLIVLRDAVFIHEHNEERDVFPLLRSTQESELLERMASDLVAAEAVPMPVAMTESEEGSPSRSIVQETARRVRAALREAS